ncbi:MAG TPA: phosphoglycerate kinase [Vicinamibacterales bacterium]|nr:phosphoglycerate kinase [Vicinamibacterales bacterium]
MAKLSIRDLDLGGKRVFIRVDFNVPLKNGVIGDDTRIRASLPTIQYALDHGASSVVLASHLGRPKGRPNPELSLRPVADRLAQLLGQPVAFEKLEAGKKITLLENLRFDPREEKNDAEFAKSLAALADLYVDDAFGAAHRAHASVEAIAHLMPKAAAGLLMEQELRYLGHALESPERPFVAIIGGAKVSDKLEVIENMLGKVDRLIIGGAMAYTFFKSRGIPVGKSLVEDDKLDAARKIEADASAKKVALALPVDHVVADKVDAGAATEVLEVGDKAIGDRMGLDIGPETIRKYEGLLADAKTVVWNGPMGVFEIDKFAAGTNAVAKAVAAVRGTTIIGGGDSIAAIRKAGMADRVTHISTGGGASLEFLGGRTLPGVAALTEKAG